MSELRADILREVERAIEDFQPVDVTTDAIMALIEADKRAGLTGLKPGVTYYARVNGGEPAEIQVGDPYEGNDPADCPSMSPDGWFCTEPEGHVGMHLASNGTELVGKWL
jgi:hypothetical protein